MAQCNPNNYRDESLLLSTALLAIVKTLHCNQMRDFSKNKFTKKIISLNPNKALWTYGLFLPMFVIWLRHVGLYAIEANGRDSNFFNYLSAILIGYTFVIFIIPIGLFIYGIEIPEFAHLAVPFIFFGIWFTCNGIVSRNMIHLENKDNEYFGGVAKSRDYIFSFFHLFYFTFSIYLLQKDVNKFIEE